MPGSTVRGLLETLLVPGRAVPLVKCLHESSAVAIAHGYTKTSGRPAAVLLHSSVGLLNGAMAIYNAALDFAPLVLLVGTAPQRPERRRPWIDRIHAGEELAGLTEHLVKHVGVAATLDETLAGVSAAIAAAVGPPRGPAVVFVDRDALEEPFGPEHALPAPVSRPRVPPDPGDVEDVAAALASALHPVLLAGRLGLEGWPERVRLAESAGMAVLTDLRLPGAFPTSHPCYAGGLDVQGRPFGDAVAVLAGADLVLALEWADPRTVSELAGWTSEPPGELFDVRLDDLVPAPLGARAESFPVAHRRVAAEAQLLVAALQARIAIGVPRVAHGRLGGPRRDELDDGLSLPAVAQLLREALRPGSTTLVKVPVEWQGHWWEIDDGLAYLGYDGGGGLGSGPGLLVGAALGLDGDRLAVAVLGDGDVLMGAQALWSAATAGVAALLVVVDNQGYANEARHLEKVTEQRRRAVDWEESVFPFRAHPVDVGGIARDLGVPVFGPARDVASAGACLESSLGMIRSGRSALVHLQVADPRGGRAHVPFPP
jgi:thiamine pyrophosphate-dependent acetolactate synthase large subunit-like protein